MVVSTGQLNLSGPAQLAGGMAPKTTALCRTYETVNTAVNLGRMPFFAAPHSALPKARISARPLGQAPVTVFASPVSQEREVWLSGTQGVDMDLTPQRRHLYVPRGLAGIYLASSDLRSGPLQFTKVKMIFLLMSMLDLCAS